jgi:hypothetical protein
MTPIAPSEKLSELDQDLRQAWADYQDRLQPLSGSEYESAELDAWTELQAELRQLERRRRLLDLATD